MWLTGVVVSPGWAPQITTDVVSPTQYRLTGWRQSPATRDNTEDTVGYFDITGVYFIFSAIYAKVYYYCLLINIITISKSTLVQSIFIPRIYASHFCTDCEMPAF